MLCTKSAIVMPLVIAGLVAFTFVPREAQIATKEAPNAGGDLDIDKIGNGAKITAALFEDSATGVANSSLEEWSTTLVDSSPNSSFNSQSSVPDREAHLKEWRVERQSTLAETAHGVELKSTKSLLEIPFWPGQKLSPSNPQSEALKTQSIVNTPEKSSE